MANTNRPIFRAKAVQAYARGQEETVMPRFLRPNTVRYLWLLLGLLVAGVFVTGSAQAPIYATGPAVVARTLSLPASSDDYLLVLFLPPEHSDRLQVGQQVLLAQDGRSFVSSIATVLPAISSPAAAQKQFTLSGSAAGAISGPSATAVLNWSPPQDTTPAAAFEGTVYRGRVTVDSRPLYSFLPGFSGRWEGKR